MNIISLRCKNPINKEILEKHRDIQLIDSRLVAGIEHIEFAITQAEKAFDRKENVSQDFLIEVMVRMSGQRQIQKAFEMFGLKDSTEVVLISENSPDEFLKDDGWVRDDSILEVDEEKYARIRRAFGIGRKEIEAGGGDDKVATLLEILRERMALIPIL